MAAAHHLPHMPAADLEQFLAESASELNLTSLDAEVFRLRRRRSSLEQHFEDDDAVAADVREDEGANKHVPLCAAKVVVLGDDVPAKLEALGLFAVQGGAPATNSAVNRPHEAHTGVLPVFTRGVPVTGADDQTALWDIEVWAPEASELHRHHRAEVLHGASAVVITYSVKSRASLEHAQTKWAAEVKAFNEAHASPGAPALPVVLVGLEAEARNAKGASPATVAIPAVEAVQAAQDVGAVKYMEVFADNAHHIQEVFCQTAAAVDAARAESGLPASYLRDKVALHSSTFRTHAKLATPAGSFDLVRRTFSVSCPGGVAVDLTLDGSDPRDSRTKRRYTGPLQFAAPYPKAIRVVAIARCRLPSDVVEFDVPSETQQPSGFFDAVTKTLRLFGPDATPSASIRFTLDGSDPTAHSASYAGPVALDGDGSAPLGAWSAAQGPPRGAKAFAVAEGCFRSPVVAIEAPTSYDAPKVTYSAHTSTLVIETTAAAGTVDVRYTLDGSAPTMASPLYVRPVALPRETNRRIRAACFPRLRFASSETVIETGQHSVNAGKSTFLTNKSAMARAQAHGRAADSADGPAKMAPGSRGVSSRYMDAAVSPARDNGGTPQRRGQSPRASAKPSQKPVATPRGASAVVRSGSPVSTRRGASPRRPAAPSGPGTSTPAKNTPTATAKSAGPPRNVSCAAEENTVNFAFEQPVSLSHVTVATPGAGRGPGMYELYARVLGDDPDRLQLVGGGVLDDFEGVQTMPVQPAVRLQPIVHVRCVFIAASHATDALFQINDLRVHGKPFKR